MSDSTIEQIIDKAMKDFEGDMTVLGSAVGALVMGERFGWHVLRLIFSSRTFKKYEDVLQVKFREVLKERTPDSTRVNGIRLADKLGKFWEVVTTRSVSNTKAKFVKKVK